MNKKYYADIALRGNSKIFNKISEDITLIFPYMSRKWRKGCALQIYNNWMKGNRKDDYFTIMYDGDLFRSRAYTNIVNKMKSKIILDNATLMGVENESF